MKSDILSSLKKLSNNNYIFLLITIFYLALLFTNLSNKTILASFILLFIFVFYKLKSLSISFIVTHIASLVILTGKTYQIQLIPSGIFPIEIFPQGYFTNLTITPSNIISFFMLIFILRSIIIKNVAFRYNDLKFPDLLIALFFVLKILSALIASNQFLLSLASEILLSDVFVLYFFIRMFTKFDNKFLEIIIYLLCGLVLFESSLSFLQLVSRSPLYKTLEYQVNIEYYGKTVGETEFTFRPVGTFDHANTLGIWLASTLVFLYPFTLNKKPKTIQSIFLIGIVAMVSTLSRSAWLGFIGGISFSIYYLWSESSKAILRFASLILKLKLIFVPVFISLFFIFILPRIFDSLNTFNPTDGGAFFRKIQLLDTLEIIKINPILGIGSRMSVFEGIILNLYTFAAPTPLFVHNWYAMVSLENGIPTMLVFLAFVLITIRSYWYQKYKLSKYYIAVTSTIVCLAVIGIFQPYINLGFVLILLSISNNAIITQKQNEENII